MKLFKWGFAALSLAATICLAISFFMQDVKPITQITLLIQSVGYCFISAFAIGAEM